MSETVFVRKEMVACCIWYQQMQETLLCVFAETLITILLPSHRCFAMNAFMFLLRSFTVEWVFVMVSCNSELKMSFILSIPAVRALLSSDILNSDFIFSA